ncbi:SA1362 family protein [Ornithinibacillus sp. 179-J 7C1 HS]|uniref:SA1362 family protein n=1 Tax=Ornithinibacillus sp. 179-J 7C1 HS TaxID=3142384 RepID=UPI00399F12CB
MRKNSIIKFIIYGIVGLAVLGLIIQLFGNTTGFLLNILVSIIIGITIFGLIYFFILGGRNKSTDAKKYKQAVRQSKSKYSHTNQTPIIKQQQTNPLKKKSKKRPSHLRVIDGNKSKRKKAGL